MIEESKWHKVSLRILGDALQVDEVTAILGVDPTFQGRKGDLIGGKPGRARYETNIWGFSLDIESAVPFETQIPKLLELVESRSGAMAKILSTSGMEVELFLGFSSGNGQGGAYFPSDLLKRISSLGLNVSLDLYPPSPSE